MRLEISLISALAIVVATGGGLAAWALWLKARR
ncbi:hypothetical protein QFZ97_002480 [Paraburkholderia youngii]